MILGGAVKKRNLEQQRLKLFLPTIDSTSLVLLHLLELW